MMPIKLLKFYLVPLLLFSPIGLDAFTFGIDNKIAIEEDIDSLKRASHELANYMAKITGERPEIINHTSGQTCTIVLKKTLKKLKPDGFFLETVGNNLVISAENERGLFYGLYHLLEYYAGCKFLSADEEYIPHFKFRELGEISYKGEPRFLYREIFMLESDDISFATKCRLNGRSGHRRVEDKRDSRYAKVPAFIYNHNFSSRQLLGDRYACNGQFEYDNKAAQKEALHTLEKLLAKTKINPREPFVIEHEDRGSYCTRGLKEGDSPTRPFLEFTLYIAHHVIQKYTRNHFLFQAYLWSRSVPQNQQKLPDYLGVSFAPIEADFSQPLYAETNSALYQDLLDWCKVSEHLFIWHYTINFGGYFTPYPNLFALDQDIKTFAKLPEIKDIFLQGSYDTLGGDLADLRVWVFSKLLWNPKADIDRLIGEFCYYYYGAAADDVVSYIHTVDRFLKESGEKLSLKTAVGARYLSPENLGKLDRILIRASQKVNPDSHYKKHINKLFAGIDFIRILRADSLTDKASIKQRFKTFLEENPGVTTFAEGVESGNLHSLIEIERTRASIPKEAKGLKKGNDWLDFQEYQLKLCCATLVADKDASDGVSARMLGSSDEWGFQLPLQNLSKAKWNIYARVKIKLHEGEKSLLSKAQMALAYGIHPTARKWIALVGEFKDDIYKVIHIGSVDLETSNAESVWLRPPKNDVVKYLYLDRIYLIKE